MRLFSYQVVNVEQGVQEVFEIIQVILTGCITKRIGRIRMGLDEDSINARSHAGPANHAQVLASAAARER